MGLLVMPVVTRLYSPAEYGSYAVYYGFIAIAAPMVCLRADLLVPAAKGPLRALSLMLGGAVVASLVAVVLTIVLVARPDILMWTGSELAGLPPWLPVLGMWLAALNAMLHYWQVRVGAFKRIAAVALIQALVTFGLQVGLARVLAGASGLVWGDVIGRLLALTILASPLLSERRLLVAVRYGRLLIPAWQGARRDIGWNVIWSVLQTAAIQLPVILAMQVAGASAAGLLACAVRVLEAPRQILGTTLGYAWYSRAAAQVSVPGGARELADSYARHLRSLVILMVPFAALLIVSGPGAFSLLFGNEWAVAGELAAITAPFYLSRAVVWPLRQSLLVVCRQDILVVCEAMVLAILVAVSTFHWMLELEFRTWLLLFTLPATLAMVVQAGWHRRVLATYG